MLRSVFAFLLMLAVMVGIAPAALPPGRPLPDIPMMIPGRKPLDLKQYRGKPLVLVIFATTCKHCEEALAAVDKLNAEFSPRVGFVMAAVEPNAAGMVGVWNHNNKRPYPVGYFDVDPYLKITDVHRDQTVQVPIFLFIDPKGLVRVRLLGDDPLLNTMERSVRTMVLELLKEPK